MLSRLVSISKLHVMQTLCKQSSLVGPKLWWTIIAIRGKAFAKSWQLIALAIERLYLARFRTSLKFYGEALYTFLGTLNASVYIMFKWIAVICYAV